MSKGPPGFEKPYVLNAYKDATFALCKQKKWDTTTVEQVWMLLIEEIGELAGSIRRTKKHFSDTKKISISDEFGDVMSYLFQIASMLEIDLDTAWQKNQVKAYQKVYITNNQVK